MRGAGCARTSCTSCSGATALLDTAAATPVWQHSVMLQHCALPYACRRAGEGGDLVTAQLTATIAAVLKRGWLDADEAERHAFFAEVEAAVTSHASSAAARRAGIQILEVRAPPNAQLLCNHPRALHHA